MTYNPAIPGATDLISSSQSQIQTNFSQADTAFGVNHTAFSVALNQGKHKKVDLVQIATPGASANQAVLYCKLVGSSSEIFMQRDAVATEIQLTSGVPINSANGETFLPGLNGAPFGMKWGQFVMISNPQTFAYVGDFVLSNFSAFTRTVQLTPINSVGVGNYRVSTFNNLGFTVAAPIGATFLFLAIGA